ncbi:MAG TPA: pilus assembly protein N-terminal domain-containing protein [Rhizomicrobium sp.]|nr:pilus assembly protein N-terminal domain-containing protein [Rhizomicrobium sp.]
MRRALLPALLIGAFAAPALAGTVSVPMDEVRIVAFKEPVSTVFMGNPTIADVNMIDSRHAFVLGKTFGETNLIALGANGRQVANDHVTVFGRRTGMVTLNKGVNQYNFTCTSAHCETQPVPGDEKGYFDSTTGAVQAHEDLGVKSASIGANGGPGAQ